MTLQPVRNEKLSSLFTTPDKDFKDHVPEMKPKKPRKEAKKYYTPGLESQKAQSMNNGSAIDSRGDKFLSANQGTVRDEGGSGAYMGKETNNSIWDSEILQRLADKQSNHEKTAEEKEHTEKVRNGFKQERMDSMVDSLQDSDLRKANTVGDLTAADGSAARSRYRMPENNISIFDTGNFDRVPEKSEGDKVREAARAPKEKDDSWRGPKPAQKLNDKISKLFD
tara:strand:- start:288 stop:959 length:672 start_codon:yes stop_codon:yes gene_type:complete